MYWREVVSGGEVCFFCLGLHFFERYSGYGCTPPEVCHKPQQDDRRVVKNVPFFTARRHHRLCFSVWLMSVFNLRVGVNFLRGRESFAERGMRRRI